MGEQCTPHASEYERHGERHRAARQAERGEDHAKLSSTVSAPNRDSGRLRHAYRPVREA